MDLASTVSAVYASVVATWDEVSSLAMALPEVTAATAGDACWKVRDKLFLWERPLRKGDLVELGDSVPTGPILAARVPDEGVKRALIDDEPDVYFTTSHFTGYPAVLIRLDALDDASLRELVVEAWLSRAPKRLVREYLEQT
jgi:hypothetical protein